MKRLRLYLTLTVLCVFSIGIHSIFAQNVNAPKLIQLYGVVMTADSLKGLPSATIELKQKGRGTIANDHGVFSIVVEPGDKVSFSYVGYKPVEVTIPTNLKNDQYSLIQLMTEDTVYLPATVIRTHKPLRQLEWEFVHTEVPDDNAEIARKNLDYYSRRALAASLPMDATEVYQMRMNSSTFYNNYQGSGPPINIVSPTAWKSFVESWKRGDYRNSRRK